MAARTRRIMYGSAASMAANVRALHRAVGCHRWRSPTAEAALVSSAAPVSAGPSRGGAPGTIGRPGLSADSGGSGNDDKSSAAMFRAAAALACLAPQRCMDPFISRTTSQILLVPLPLSAHS